MEFQDLPQVYAEEQEIEQETDRVAGVGGIEPDMDIFIPRLKPWAFLLTRS